jgi:hypothetical protein
MGGRAAGAGFPVLFGVYLLYSHLAESKLFSHGPQAAYHTVLSALGAFLLMIGLVFLYKNLK